MTLEAQSPLRKIKKNKYKAIPNMQNRIMAKDEGNRKLIKSHMYVDVQYESMET